MATLLLRLAGPLQSWGNSSRFEYRDTEYFPTKSAIVGMIAAAMGRSRTESIEDLKKFKLGIRVDQQGVKLYDYQTVKAPYTDKSFVTRRVYLSDAVFTVGLESENRAYLEWIRNALNAPYYALYLGRRSCIPSFPIAQNIVDDSLVDALQKSKKNNEKNVENMQVLIESDSGEYRVQDDPISFDSKYRQYGIRYMKSIYKKTPHEDDEYDFLRK